MYVFLDAAEILKKIILEVCVWYKSDYLAEDTDCIGRKVENMTSISQWDLGRDEQGLAASSSRHNRNCTTTAVSIACRKCSRSQKQSAACNCPRKLVNRWRMTKDRDETGKGRQFTAEKSSQDTK